MCALKDQRRSEMSRAVGRASNMYIKFHTLFNLTAGDSKRRKRIKKIEINVNIKSSKKQGTSSIQVTFTKSSISFTLTINNSAETRLSLRN